MRMSKTAIVSLAIGAVMVAAFVPASLPPAGASTTACGSRCTSPSNELLGTGQVLAVANLKNGTVDMAAASSSNSAEDWSPLQEGSVTLAAQAGVVSARLDMNYSGDTLMEYQYAPNGTPSDDCLADGYQLASPDNLPTTSVTLATCGTTAATLWILDGNGTNGYIDLINAGYEAAYEYLAPDSVPGAITPTPAYASPFAEPAVLTASNSGDLTLAPLSEIGGVVSPSQDWANWSAPGQAQLRQAVERSAAARRAAGRY
jgi:hypothetical protein